jgi:YidC/Oxa1 family membrane protein insertase
MNNTRQLITFVLASALLLLGYWWLNDKYGPKPNPSPINVGNVAVPHPDYQPQNTQSPEGLVPPPIQGQHPVVETGIAPPQAGQVDATPVDRRARFTESTNLLELTWRQYDGALVQAVWKKDKTRFFPVEVREVGGKIASAEFLGIGGAVNTVFTGEPQVTEDQTGKTVVFSNPNGECLSYHLPADGYILDVTWFSPISSPMYLIRSLQNIPLILDPYTGESYPADPFKGLENGRVYTIEGKKVQAVTWDKILTDPWFTFLGRKRKELPPTAINLGLDAGFEETKKQTTHYFAAIWSADHLPRRDMTLFPGYHLTPNPSGSATARLYLGPKQAEYLETFHPDGQPEKGEAFLKVMDFGFFGLIAKFLFIVLQFIQKFIPNWGWALVAFSVLVRLSLWTLNTKTTKGMLRQKDLEPHQKQIQAKYEKFGKDMAKKQEMQRELMAFYKKNGHNPMGSCLPMLAQMPVFMALWSMLQNVFELRKASWIFWIKDLSAPDPYFILPGLMVGTMIAQQAMAPPMGDPQQRKMMMVLMPAMMGFFFAYTPAGLTLYYFIFNIVSMGQTWWLMRTYKPQPVVI